MTMTPSRTSPPTKLEVGAAMPAAAYSADARSSQARLMAAGGTQLTCSSAQKKVRAAEERFSAAQARLSLCDVEPDDQTLAQLDTLQAAVREARQARDALMQTWAAAVAAFRRRHRTAGNDGAPTA